MRKIDPWGIFFSFLGLGAMGGVAYLIFKTDSETEGFETTFVDSEAAFNSSPKQDLIPPLKPPVRSTTPNGYFMAARPVGSAKVDHYHQGVDLRGEAGEAVLAMGDGKIVPAKAGLGELVRVLLLDDGRAIVYADLGTATVDPGMTVKAGEKIGTVRKNGFVHVAIRDSRYGKFLNPEGMFAFNDSRAKRVIS